MLKVRKKGKLDLHSFVDISQTQTARTSKLVWYFGLNLTTVSQSLVSELHLANKVRKEAKLDLNS